MCQMVYFLEKGSRRGTLKTTICWFWVMSGIHWEIPIDLICWTTSHSYENMGPTKTQHAGSWTAGTTTPLPCVYTFATAAFGRKFLLQPSSCPCTPSGSHFRCFTWWHPVMSAGSPAAGVPGFSIPLYPDSLKIARVKPIFKGGNKNDSTLYRPISILTQINRIFEKLLRDRLYAFVKDKLYRKHFGFCPKNSTKHPVLDLK